jgi:hypothetical protein
MSSILVGNRTLQFRWPWRLTTGETRTESCPTQMGIQPGAQRELLFNFLNLLPYNAPYDIKIRSNPTNRQCFLQFNTGVIRSRTSNLLVQCAPANNCISNSDPQQGCSTGTFCSKQNRCLACNLCDINVDDTTPRNFSSCALACASPTSPSLPWWKQSMWIAGFTNMCMCDELFFLY